MASTSNDPDQFYSGNRTSVIIETVWIRAMDTNQGTKKQQFILLYNIAEVTGQILEQANAISSVSEK